MSSGPTGRTVGQAGPGNPGPAARVVASMTPARRRPRLLPGLPHHGRTALLVVLAAAVLTGPGALVPSATASCAGPLLALAPGATPAPGRSLTVAGTGFADGCQDTGSDTGWGCSAPAEPVTPLEDVRLELVQGGRTRLLGTADAGPAGRDRYAEVRWRVRLPDTLRPGPATLRAGDAVLRVVVAGAQAPSGS